MQLIMILDKGHVMGLCWRLIRIYVWTTYPALVGCNAHLLLKKYPNLVKLTSM